jgi:ribosome-associated protein
MQFGRFHVPDAEFALQFSRSGGPGGQNVNKVNSRVQLRWNVAGTTALPDDVKQRFLNQFRTRINAEGELMLDCDETRDQHKNRAIVFERLTTMLAAVAKPPKKRIPTKPSRAARNKRLKDREKRAQKKEWRRKVDW